MAHRAIMSTLRSRSFQRLRRAASALPPITSSSGRALRNAPFGVGGGAWRSLETTPQHEAYKDKKAVAERVLAIVQNSQKVEPSKVIPSAHFQKDLGLDSLDTVEIVMALEEAFNIEIPDKEAEKILSCADAIDYICSLQQAKNDSNAQ